MNRRPWNDKGHFVLYWMHHAVRSHENPALDTALIFANQQKLPVLVYQGLGGNHPYNSDRHHTFIMEGARDVQRQLQDRQIAYVFQLARRPSDAGMLKNLIRMASLVVSEDFPAPPLTRWTQRLAQSIGTAMVVVDCACILPMQCAKKSYSRAFEFRNDTRSEYENRIFQSWVDVRPEVEPCSGEFANDTIDLGSADIADLCAQCEIDHSIGPVYHTPGGSEAGYARWELFKLNGLKSYARLRNDAEVVFPRGVSRLSPYLHHGQVSPFRIAREAARQSSAGADKFLDELLIWRELAHNFCFHHEQPEKLEALPGWARRTLDEHRNDPRPNIYSWETLARAQTGDPLWDAAQRSLLIHGELHNNVRMTWGKAILHWTRDPAQALRRMIDLNHRYALDGSDPNSYGGLLWCLGLFDRPFKPPKPIIGTLRPRSTRSHAGRLDMAAYRAKIERPSTARHLSIAIIGAGLAGLVAARTIADHGHKVSVFEMMQNPGGRMATVKSEGYSFDCGAQYFTVRDERFRRYVESWQADGVAKPWRGQFAVVRNGRITPKSASPERWVGVPSQNALAIHMSQKLAIKYGSEVATIKRQSDSWQIGLQGGRNFGDFDAAILAVPAPKVVALLGNISEPGETSAQIRMNPCQAVTVAFDPALELPYDGAFVHDSPLTWIARNNSKPGRHSSDCWVLHAGPQWSAEHRRTDESRRCQMLLEAFFRAVSIPPVAPVFISAQYWPNASARNPLNIGCLWDQDRRIGACGDWCQMSRVEGAFLSGMSAAARVLGLMP